MLMVLVEAAVAGDWVGLMVSDKEERQGTDFREVRERQAINMREANEKKGLGIRGRQVSVMEDGREKPAGREVVEVVGLQCLQEELLLCTEQLTSTLKRCNISYYAATSVGTWVNCVKLHEFSCF